MTAVIPVHNGERFVADAVNSVRAQTYAPVECVVIDDGSDDGTEELVRAFGSSVRYFRVPRGGVARARNVGIEKAAGEYVAFLDADDVWLPEKLERQMSLFRTQPALGLVYSAVYRVDERLDDRELTQAPPGGEALRRVLLLDPAAINLAMTGVVPRRVLESVGGFDERLSTSADADLACRIACRYPVERVAEPLALYRQHAGQMHQNLSAMEHDMSLIYEKLFRSEGLPADLYPARARALATLEMILAASYAQQRRPVRALSHGLKALWQDPRYAARTVVRRFGRALP